MAGITRAEFVARGGITHACLSRYESGALQPSFESICALLGVVNVSLSATSSSGTAEQRASAERLELRSRVEQHLQAQGFTIRDGRITPPEMVDKAGLRAWHADAVTVSRERARAALARREQDFVRRLADGRSVDPGRIEPALVLIDGFRSMEALLWRWCSLHWSIPVSAGYGRRLRFLVVDRAHGDAVIGLIGLGDPVFSLGCRDQYIGWDTEQRRERLTCVMDAFVLGAVPPYNGLLGGKLVALLATSEPIREAFAQRYGHRRTLIAERDPDADLAMVTTASALGRSSVYNRLVRPDGTLAFRPVGYTAGSGDFHFSGPIYDELAAYAAKHATGTNRHKRWGGGAASFRNRREVLQRALQALGYAGRQMRLHGVRRQLFCAPLAGNAPAWLTGHDPVLQPYTLKIPDIAEWWQQRWALPRVDRAASWRDFRPEQWRLYE